jgi:phytoene dehydrogenase-like protein
VDQQGTNRVVIVGAGLAGLACAIRLNEQGQQILLLESSDRVGGRLRTEKVQGFLLDRGFQVFLDAYPEARELLDIESLDLRPFRPGALIFKEGKLHRLMDVFRCPGHALSSAFQPIGSVRDKLLVGKMRLQSLWPRSSPHPEDDLTTEEYLRGYGFSPAMIDEFFRAFYGGIFLERDLRTSSQMFRFTFRMFSLGNATLPARGMEAIPRQLASRLPQDAIRLNSPVAAVNPGEVTLASGEVLRARQVVIATDAEITNRLAPASGEEPKKWRSVVGLYFSAPKSPLGEPIIALNGEDAGLVNNVCAVSDVAPPYAPRDRALISVSVLGLPDHELLEEEVRTELRNWFGSQVDRWEHLRSDRIRRALPEQRPERGPRNSPAYRERNGIIICGDHCTTASIEGALVSGLRAAESLLPSKA